MVRIKDLYRSLIQWVHADRLSSPDLAPLPSPTNPHPRFHPRLLDSSESNTESLSADDGPEFAPDPPKSPVYVPCEVAFPERVTRTCRVSRPPQRDPYIYPLCAMAFPPRTPSLPSSSLHSRSTRSMSDPLFRPVRPVDPLNAPPAASQAPLRPVSARYPGIPTEVFNRIAADQRLAGGPRYVTSPPLVLDQSARRAAEEGPLEVMPGGLHPGPTGDLPAHPIHPQPPSALSRQLLRGRATVVPARAAVADDGSWSPRAAAVCRHAISSPCPCGHFLSRSPSRLPPSCPCPSVLHFSSPTTGAKALPPPICG